jgi:transcriptional regulator with XRE-family HTH domain
MMADKGSGKDDPEGRRFRLLRQAEGYESGMAFANYLGWSQSMVSQYETGQRRITRDGALQLLKKVPGFDPVWLWTGDKKNLSFDLRKRIEAVEGQQAEAITITEKIISCFASTRQTPYGVR